MRFNIDRALMGLRRRIDRGGLRSEPVEREEVLEIVAEEAKVKLP